MDRAKCFIQVPSFAEWEPGIARSFRQLETLTYRCLSVERNNFLSGMHYFSNGPLSQVEGIERNLLAE
jgi:hypothetical protein